MQILIRLIRNRGVEAGGWMPQRFTLNDIEAKAQSFRDELHLGDVFVPFLFASILEKMKKRKIKVNVIPDNEQTNIEGSTDCAKRTIEIPRSLYLSGMRGGVREIMTLLHEVGHIELGHKGVLHRIRRRKSDFIRTKKERQWEQEAGHFAAAVLMPFASVRGLDEIEKIQREHNVSRPAAAIRRRQVYEVLREAEEIERKRSGIPKIWPRGALEYLLSKQKGGHPISSIAGQQAFLVGTTKKGDLVYRATDGTLRLEESKSSPLDASRTVDVRMGAVAKEMEGYWISRASGAPRFLSEKADEVTLTRYVRHINQTHNLQLRKAPLSYGIFAELRHFGIDTIADLDGLISAHVLAHYTAAQIVDTSSGFIRSILMASNLKKYLRIKLSWCFIERDDLKVLATVYGEKTALEALEASKIMLLEF
jgi:Zn-dependent peptidase ImmA (M78 family)